MLNRKEAPAIIHTSSLPLHLKPCNNSTLHNNVPVYDVMGGTQEVVQVEWVFRAGNLFESKNGVAAAVSHLLKNGTSTLNAFQINEKLEFYGAYLNRACYNETAVVTLSCLSKHLPVLLPLIRELLTDARFPEEELQIYQQNAQQKLLVNLQKCDFVANRLIDTYVYGFEHPYGKYLSAEDYAHLQRSDLVEFYQKYFQNGHCTIFAAGLLPESTSLVPLLNQYFGDLPLNKNEMNFVWPAPSRAQEHKYSIVNDPNGVQGAIRLATPMVGRKHPDFQKCLVLNNLFGGFFGSRLMSNIREDKGYTYGIYSYIQNHLSQDTAWMIATEAGRTVCDATLREVYFEMNALCEDLVEDEELQLVRNYMMGSILGDLDGPFHIIARWKNIILNELNESYFYESMDTIRSVSPEDLRNMAQKYLQPSSFYELVVV